MKANAESELFYLLFYERNPADKTLNAMTIPKLLYSSRTMYDMNTQTQYRSSKSFAFHCLASHQVINRSENCLWQQKKEGQSAKTGKRKKKKNENQVQPDMQCSSWSAKNCKCS